MIANNYIETAQDEFGAMFDYAINDCGIDVNNFQNLFLKSKVAAKLENHDLLLISGKSGIELANTFIPKQKQKTPSYPLMHRSKEYWCGFVLAYLWLNSYYTFEQIFSKISLFDIRALYNPYHEMDITHFYEYMCKLIEGNKLQDYRKKAKLSQSELSTLSNVPLKTIQKYERKEILLMNASAINLYRLSKALNCTIENLLI